MEIAKREKALLAQLDYKDGYSLYVGIPFCPTTCSYCSFTSQPIHKWKDRVDEYLDALCKEITFVGEVSKEKKLNTVYIGGGTPTTLEPEQLERLLSHIEKTFSFEDLKEFTVEAGRPDSITKEKLEVLRRHQISRISINPQTMQQKTLDCIGRKHTVEDIRQVYAMARELGFENINMDLIAGLPGETLDDMKDTLRQIEMFAPDSLTVHALAMKRASRLTQENEREAIGESRPGRQCHDVIGDDRTRSRICGENSSSYRIICIGRRILREILKMLVMQRLTKPEYTIYLLWKRTIYRGCGSRGIDKDRAAKREDLDR